MQENVYFVQVIECAMGMKHYTIILLLYIYNWENPAFNEKIFKISEKYENREMVAVARSRIPYLPMKARIRGARASDCYQ